MTHINIKISKAVATAEKDGIITTGMVGVPVSFMFDSWWDGLIVTAVFKGSGAPISVPLLGATETVVPWEVLKRPSTLLRIGAEGRLPDGTLVIPTTWATVGIVMSGANATDDLAKPPTPTAFDRIMSQIGNMNDLATEDKSSLVAAVNEAMKKGGGVDVSGASVGQIIKVAAVDDTGKPTAWEPADLPEQVQSDWEQNDDSCADFVKNRPFYTSDTKIECYREQEITFDEKGIAGSLSSSDSDSYLSDGDTITVIVDGVPYSGKAYNSGPPIYEIWWEASPFSYDFRGVSCSDSNFYGKTVKIQIFKVETSIVKMDKQFLPPISVNDLDDFPETVGKKTKDGGETFNGTMVAGNYAHAEGYYSEAPGWYSHSEGTSTIASGVSSHSEGTSTIARGENSHVQGKYNVEDKVIKYAHIVGNGTDDDNRSNAHTLDWSGNAWFAGEVKVGGTGQNDIAAKTLATTEDIPTVDGTLTQSSQAADAKATGDAIRALSEEIVTTSESKVAAHNTGTDTHSDIRLLIQGLTDRLNALADSDDTTLDQFSEVVAYIKSNRSLIGAITTSKVSVADIVDDLTTNVSNKPLSAAQGVAIKTLIDALRNDKLDASELPTAINTALAQAKASGEFDGTDGKTAYQYAVEGGYTGTETEFAAKLAQEIPSIDSTLTQSGQAADAAAVGNRLSALSDGDVVPDYVQTEAESVSAKVQADRKAGSLVLPIFTDFHIWADDAKTDESYVNTRSSVVLAGQALSELRKRVGFDAAAMLGDYTWGGKPYTAEQIMADITYVKRTFADGLKGVTTAWLTGNHDINYPANRDRIVTADEQYAYIAANSPELVRDPDNLAGNYGYLDFQNQRIRLVCLNTTDVMEEFPDVDGADHTSENIGEKQAKWFATKALDFSDKSDVSSWGIVILSHHPISIFLNRGFILKLLEAYKNSESGSVTANFTPYPGYPAVNYTIDYDYTGVEKARILCNIHGHIHNCAYGYMSSAENVTPWMLRLCIPQVCFTRNNEAATSTDTNYAQKYGEFDSDGNPVYYQKTAGTAQGTSFCVVDINKADRMVHAYIYGAGIDRNISMDPVTYTVTFESNGGSVVAAQMVSAGGKAAAPDNPTKDNYTFAGWYLDAGLTNAYDFDTAVTSNITLYAKWEEAQTEPSYTNQIPISTDASGNVIGLVANTYISSSSGNTSAKSGYSTTGFIPITGSTSADIIRFANAGWSSTDSHCRMGLYNADKTFIGTINGTGILGDSAFKNRYALDDSGDYVSLDLSAKNNYFIVNRGVTPKYIRLCSPGFTDDSIVTVNEPIA